MSSHLDKVSDAIPDSAKQFYGRWKWLAPWLVGGIVGLILGLVIGWGVWPVEWTNARLSDLSQAERAAYISAVADAYVLDGRGYAEVNMHGRLSGFGDRLPDEVLAAIEYYRADANVDQVQLGNLALLATNLGIPVDATALQSAAVANESPAQPLMQPVTIGDNVAAPAENSGALAPQATTNEGGSGIWAWLLAIVVAGGLIGGGLYLLRYLNKRAIPSDELIAPPPASMPGEMRAPQELDSTGGPKRASFWRDAGRSAGSAAPAHKSPDDLSFDDEDEDEEPAVRFGSSDFDDLDDEDDYEDDPVNDARYGAPVARPDKSPAPAFPGTAVGTPYSGPSFGSSAPVAAPPAPSQTRQSTPAPLASAYGAPTAEALRPEAVRPETVRPEPVPVRTAPQRRSDVATAPAPAAAPNANRKIIASYTCEYHSGIPDYIEAHNISDPVTGRYIGECGMGISSKNRALHNNPDQVIALEVWMYDKLDPRDNINNTRVLLSEYAADRDFAQAFSRERDGAVKTFLAVPGTRFSLEGRNLTLEGEVIRAEFDRDGIFAGAKVTMNIISHK